MADDPLLVALREVKRRKESEPPPSMAPDSERVPKVEVDADVSIPPRRRRIMRELREWILLAGMVGGLGMGVSAKVDASRVPAGKVEAHSELISDEKSKSDDMTKWRGELATYQEHLAEAYDCRFRQLASATQRTVGYKPGFKADNVEWQSLCLSQPGRVCPGPIYQATRDCPEIPAPPR